MTDPLKVPPLLGLAGRSRSGKSTVERLLWQHGHYESLAFADALKRLVGAIFDIHQSILWGPPGGRDHGIVPFDAADRTAYTQRLLSRAVVDQLIDLAGGNRVKSITLSAGIEAVIRDDEWPEKVTIRKVLQRIGDCGRAIDVDLWVNYALHMAADLQAGNCGYSTYLGRLRLCGNMRGLDPIPVVITDVRHPNEAAAVRKHGAPVWWLEASKRVPPNDDIAHISEPTRESLARWITHDLDRNGVEHGGYAPDDPAPILAALQVPTPAYVERKGIPPINAMCLPEQARGWMCGECLRLYLHSHYGTETEERARVCCQRDCDWKDCTTPRRQHSLFCEVHAVEARARSERARFELAEKVENYTGALYVPSEDGPQEGFFASMGDLLDYYSEKDRPEYAYVTWEDRASCSASDVIENALSDHHEDARDGIDGEEELQAFLEAWWAKQKVVTWRPDYKRVVLIPRAEPSPVASPS